MAENDNIQDMIAEGKANLLDALSSLKIIAKKPAKNLILTSDLRQQSSMEFLKKMLIVLLNVN